MATILEPKIARHAPESSDRSFGLLFAAVLAVIGCLPLLHAHAPRWWSFGLSLLFAAIALRKPSILHSLNRGWLAVGRLLHRIMSPIVMGAIFFLCVTPIAYIMRMRHKDLLGLSRRSDRSSYWITREPSAPPTVSMKQQF